MQTCSKGWASSAVAQGNANLGCKILYFMAQIMNLLILQFKIANVGISYNFACLLIEILANSLNYDNIIDNFASSKSSRVYFKLFLKGCLQVYYSFSLRLC